MNNKYVWALTYNYSNEAHGVEAIFTTQEAAIEAAKGRADMDVRANGRARANWGVQSFPVFESFDDHVADKYTR